MPSEYKEEWESLTEEHQNLIYAQATHFNLNSQYQIDSFWQGRNMKARKVVLEKLESKKVDAPKVKKLVEESYLDGFQKNLAMRFKK